MIFFTHVPVKDMGNNLDMKPLQIRHIFANPLAFCFIVIPLTTQQKMGKVDVHVVGYLTCSCVALRIRFKISRQNSLPLPFWMKTMHSPVHTVDDRSSATRHLFHFPCYRCSAYSRAVLISTTGKTLRGI